MWTKQDNSRYKYSPGTKPHFIDHILALSLPKDSPKDLNRPFINLTNRPLWYIATKELIKYFSK